MKLKVTVEGKVYEVEVEVQDQGGGAAPAAPRAVAAPRAASAPSAVAPAPVAASAPVAAAGGNTFPSPLAGTVRQIKVKAGDTVAANQELMVLEAMKMETSIYSPSAGTIKAVLVNSGDAVQSGQALVEFA